jgi:urocanate hydratase
MLEIQRAGAEVFDYGNNLRQRAFDYGVKDAFNFPGFVPAYISGRSSAKAKGLSAGWPFPVIPKIFIAPTEQSWSSSRRTSTCTAGCAWPGKKYPSRGCPPASAGWAMANGRKLAWCSTSWLPKARCKAPIVIGRDHLDSGSVASPNRETEGMRDGSDAISDWPILNALINAVGGATWVSFHHGGGVGIGFSQHAGQVIVADGTPEPRRLERVLTTDPGMGVVRHADAGYEQAIEAARRSGIKIPMLRK